MPIINGRSNVKFDAVIRTDKANALLAFIISSYNARNHSSPKEKIKKSLKSYFDVFKENGSGTFGGNIEELDKQFSRNYTMGLEMGIWIDSELHLSDLAKKVACFKITVKDYISIVFLNLFTYFNVNGKIVYHHYLLNIFDEILKNNVDIHNIPKEIISNTLPKGENDKNNEQTNLLINYLISTNYFVLKEKNTLSFTGHTKDDLYKIRKQCNLESQNFIAEEAMENAKDKRWYADYITQTSDKSKINLLNNKAEETIGIPHNLIFFGAPGTGKSYQISELIKKTYPNFEEESSEESQFVYRTTLHPEYGYNDFVGQVMPVSKKDGFDYEFYPGVFTRSLEKAIAFETLKKPVFLILEELSRANVAAVFGDLFQLLDRKDGKSEYKISNSLIATYVYHLGNEEINDFDSQSVNKKIYLPKNFYILCTVNTSDQNVFVMDTAFKRRFEWEPVLTNPIRDSRSGEFLNNPMVKIDGISIFWCEFFPILNEYIVHDMELNEDKQVGQFFLNFDNKKDSAQVQKIIQNKLLQYLWEDIESVSFNKKMFNNISSFTELYTKFGKEKILKEDLYFKLKKASNNSVDDEEYNQEFKNERSE